MDEPKAPPATLHREQTRLMVLWGTALAFATKFGTILLSLVLARLIAPDVYGQYGAVSTIILFAMSFSMQRFTENIFHKTPTSEDYHRHLAFGVILHGFLFLVVNLIAFGMYLDPTLSKVSVYLHAGSISIILNVPRILYSTHLRVTLQWKLTRTLSLVSFGLYAGIAMLLAWRGLGVWALLAQNIVIPIPYVIAFAFADRGLKGLNFDWRAYLDALRFGLLRSSAAAVGTAFGAIESLTFSLTLDFASLGIFIRARGLSQLATGWLSDQLGAALYPSLAALASRGAAARRTAGILLRVNFWTSGAVAVAVAAAPHAAVAVLYGERWVDVAPLVRPILLGALAGSAVAMSSLVLLTNMGPRHSLTLDVTATVVNALGLVFVVRGDIMAYSIYLGLANPALLLVTFTYMVRLKLFDAGDILRAVLPPALATTFALGVTGAATFSAAEATWPVPVLLGAAVVSTLSVLTLARLLDPRGLETILGLLPGGALLRRALLLRPRSPL